MKSKVIIFPEPNEAKIAEIDIPAPKPGQILTRTLYTGVSTGTETRVFIGKENKAVFPLIPGYENVGEIIETTEGVNLKKGALVFLSSSLFTGEYNSCYGGQVEYALVNAERVLPVPEGINLVSALYSHVGAIALHGVKRAGICAEDTVAIVGQGLIGHLAAQCAKANGATVIAVDISDERLEISKKAGIDHAINVKNADAVEKVKEISNGGVTVAIDVTGIAKTIDTTARMLRPKPWNPPFPPSTRFVLLGSYVDPIEFSYHPTLFDNEPDIYPSRDCTFDDMKEVLDLIASGKINPGVIPARIMSFKQAEEAYNMLVNKQAMRIIYKWAEFNGNV